MTLRLHRQQYRRLVALSPFSPAPIAYASTPRIVSFNSARRHVRRNTTQNAPSRTEATRQPTRPKESHRQDQGQTETAAAGNATRPSHTEQPGRESWMRRFDRFLPPYLRYSDSNPSSADPNILPAVKIMDRARAQVGNDFDVLEYMLIDHNRDEAVLYLLDELLKIVGPHAQTPQDLPSNLQWPAALLDGALLDSFGLESPAQARRRYSDPREDYHDQSLSGSKHLTSTMRQVWLSLGRIIVAATRLEATTSQRIMSVVYRAIAKIHHYGLVPDAVYSYQPTPYSSTLNRPPILHLLSSRILTTLSDAVWRSQQEEIIAKAAADGVPLETLAKDPPGGRFRLKVREMGPEVWLEFILWCCVEGRYASTGAKIIDLLRSDTKNPWFAANWTSNDLGRSVPLVDWSRVNPRLGGTVGRIEGYSREKPLADVPARTISAEVVLSVAESVISASDVTDSAKSLVLERTARSVKNIVSFLEPHSLPSEYFDYLSARLLHIKSIDYDAQPRCLDVWVQAMGDLRDLESVKPHPSPEHSLVYPNILSQSLMGSALTQQVLMAYIHNDYYVQAVDLFNKLQYQVDKAKLQNVLGFVQAPLEGIDDPYGGGPNPAQLEYVESYGGLPQHKKAAFLQNMLVNHQIDIAAWMVLSDDVDGPLIPVHTYGEISIATGLVRLAAEINDDSILARIAEVGRKWRFRPAVKLLRHLVDAHIRRLDFHRAELILSQLRESIAGGYSPENLATLASVILRLQSSDSVTSRDVLQGSSLQQALSLFYRILSGAYDGTSGDFYRMQLTNFRQQVGHILRVLASLPRSDLQRMAKKLSAKYPTGNAPNLTPAVFNIILSGIVDTLGAERGREIWDLFCHVPRNALSAESDQQIGKHLSEDPTRTDDNEYFPDHDVREDKAGEDITSPYAVIGDDPRLEEVESGPTFTDHDGSSEEVLAGSSEISLTDLSISSTFEDLFRVASVNPEASVNELPRYDSTDQDQHVKLESLQHVDDGSTSGIPAVIPTLATVRVILRAALQQPTTAELKPLVLWAASFLRHSGLTEADIEREMQTGVQQTAATMTKPATRADPSIPTEKGPPPLVRKHWVTGNEHIHRKRELLWRSSLRVT